MPVQFPCDGFIVTYIYKDTIFYIISDFVKTYYALLCDIIIWSQNIISQYAEGYLILELKISMSEKFPAHMSAESPSNISPNPSEVIWKVFLVLKFVMAKALLMSNGHDHRF